MGWFWADTSPVVVRAPSGHPHVATNQAPPVSLVISSSGAGY